MKSGLSYYMHRERRALCPVTIPIYRGNERTNREANNRIRAVSDQFCRGNGDRHKHSLPMSQFTGMHGKRACNPASTFASITDKNAWDNCVDAANTLINKGISYIIKPPGKNGADFTYLLDTGIHCEKRKKHPDGIHCGDTWFYHKSTDLYY